MAIMKTRSRLVSVSYEFVIR